MMKVGVVGSRSFNDYKLLHDTLSNYSIGTIVSGGAKGADSLAKRYAEENNIPIVEFLPDYKNFKRRAPILRNRSIVENSTIIIAFWDGKSKGTEYTINLAKSLNIPAVVVNFKD